MSFSKDQNIYAYNILKAAKINLDQNYSFLFSTLLHLESELEYGTLPADRFSEKLLTIINQSESFPKVDRVCLSVTHPGSSRIAVLSSHNSERLRENNLLPNYSCFVSPSSSIFATKKTNVRIYSNIDEIVKIYAGKPIQRSLKRLQLMGVKSGLTIPLSVSNLVSGFLFLNSTEEGKFSTLKAEDYSTLCLIKLVAMSCLNKALFGVNGLDSRLGNILASAHQTSNKFSSDVFRALLMDVLETRFNKEIDVTVNNTVETSFLYALNPAVYTIVKAIECRDSVPAAIEIDISKVNHGEEQYIELTFRSGAFSFDQLAELKSLKLFANQEIGLSGEDFFMLSPFETSEMDYSV